jgi:predicted site-specific integrase-resolvase
MFYPSNADKEKRRVAIYIRVSTAEQKMDGYGLETQKSRLIEYVNNNVGLGLETKKNGSIQILIRGVI